MDENNKADSPRQAPDHDPAIVSQPPELPVSQIEGNAAEDTNALTNNNQNTPNELAREFKWFEIASVIINGVLALVGIAVLCVYRGQLNTMQDQLFAMTMQISQTQHMLDQTAIQANAAQQSAGAATKAVKIASDALAETRRQFITDQRPYLIIGKVHLEDEKGEVHVGQIIQYRVEFWNYGKSPALNVKGMAIVLFGQGSEETADKWFERLPTPSRRIRQGSVSIVPPGGDWSHPPYTTAVSPVAPNAEAMNFISTHEPAIYIIGRSFYEDMAGNHYFSDFCRLQLKSGAVASCARHNEVR